MEVTSTASQVHTYRPTTATSIGLFLMRVPLGVYFVMAGMAKVRGGVPNFVNSNIDHATKWMSDSLARNFLGTLPWIEIGLGVLLAAGLLTRVVGFIMSVLLISFMLGIGAWKHPQYPFHPNIIYFGIALGFVFTGPGSLSVDGLLFGRRRRVVVTEEVTDRRPLSDRPL